MLQDTLKYFAIEACTHIPLLHEMHAWARRNQRDDIVRRCDDRLRELGVWRLTIINGGRE